MTDYTDTYRGYEIDYHRDIPQPYYCHVLLDGEIVQKCHSYDQACIWIDAEIKARRTAR